MTTATIVGSGPNGLAAAAALARAGVSVTLLEAAEAIGGGTRTSEGIVPGLLHDHCSAVHPMAVGSAFLSDLNLEKYLLEWRLPQIDCVHPLDDGSAGVLHRSVTETAAGLGADERRWKRLFAKNAANYDDLAEDILQPLLRIPSHPVKLARFGMPTVLPATALAHGFKTEQAQALFGGVAAHAFQPLTHPLSSAIGLGILTAGHRHGWAVAAGGSQTITDALAAFINDHGGVLETGIRITRADQLPEADVVLYDLDPHQVARILGDRLPRRARRAYRKFRFGPGAFKVDFAVEGGVPWTATAARSAGTVHLSGAFEEIVANEAAVARGQMPARPFVLVGQQYLADPQRSVGNIHPLYTYAHVPHGYTGDATEAIIGQVERFAPGFRDRVIGMQVRTTTGFADYDSNFVGGDILTGAKTIGQLAFGPRPTLKPYDTGLPGHFICSAATPPGPGAHGMCGANAAQRALRYLERNP